MKRNDTVHPAGQIEGYTFKSYLLEQGDILLCTDPDSAISSLIKACTGGNYSHAAICTLVPLFMEANDPGVCEFSLDRMGVKSTNTVRLLRLKSDIPNRDDITTSAAREALRYSTREYDTIAAIASIVPGWGYEPGARAFCSYLVAAAYENAGLNITNDKKPPGKTTPADIEASRFFEDITGHLLVPAEFSPDAANYFLDSNGPMSPAQEHNIALRKVAERVSTFLQEKGRAPVADYLEAQRAYIEHLGEPWFDQLDDLFSQSLIDLANPLLDRAGVLVAEARAHDSGSLPARLAKFDRPSFMLSLKHVAHRIDTTERLIRDRKRDLYVFGSGVANTDWKTPRVWLAHSQRIHAELESNLQILRDELKRHLELGIERGWLTTDSGQPP